MKGTGEWNQVIKWREWLAGISTALVAFVFSVAQSKALADNPNFIYGFTAIAVIAIAILFFFVVSTEPDTLVSTWSYWWRVYLLVVLPHALAAVIVLLPPSNTSLTEAACQGVAVNSPSDGITWTNTPGTRQVLTGTGSNNQYRGWYHIMAKFVTNKDGDTTQRFWYGGPVSRRSDGAWETAQLYIGDPDVIDFTIVAVDPDSAGKTMIDYRNAVVDGRTDNSGFAFPGALPKDITSCGQVRVYGKDAKPR